MTPEKKNGSRLVTVLITAGVILPIIFGLSMFILSHTWASIDKKLDKETYFRDSMRIEKTMERMERKIDKLLEGRG